MLSIPAATMIIKKSFPDAEIVPPVAYNGLWIFQVYYNPDPEERNYDPYFSVNQTTGELRDFSIITDANPDAIAKLYQDQGATS